MTSSPNPSDSALADHLRELERSRLRALVECDMALAWRLHAPDFQLVTPGGRAFTREQYLAKIERDVLRYLRWEPDEILVRQHGGMALLRPSPGGQADHCRSDMSGPCGSALRVHPRSRGTDE